MRVKFIAGVFLVAITASVLFYYNSKANEEINEWKKLTSTEIYVADITKTFIKTSSTNKKLEKTLEDLENIAKRKETEKKLIDIKKELGTIKKELKQKKMDESDSELNKETEKLKSFMISYLELQERKIDEYLVYVKTRNEMSLEKIAKLDFEIQQTVKEYEKIENEIKKYYD